MSTNVDYSESAAVITEKIFWIVLYVVVALVALAVLRFVVVLAIDVIILGDYEHARRSLRRLLYYFCCGRMCHESTDEEFQHNTDTANTSEVVIQTQTIDCTFAEETELSDTASLRFQLTQLLPSRILSQDDYEKICCDDTATTAICSICLAQLHVGDTICETQACCHWFHAHCIHPWFKRNVDCCYCPNCRQPLLLKNDSNNSATLVLDVTEFKQQL